jgi:hypothetical protein
MPSLPIPPRSISRQFEAFANGFRMLCDGPAIRLFNACEVERLVRGAGQSMGSPDAVRGPGQAQKEAAACAREREPPRPKPPTRAALFSSSDRRRLTLTPAKKTAPQVCGNPNLDFVSMERNARYEGGYEPTNATVCWLWAVVHGELSLEEKKMFLKFLTGSDRWVGRSHLLGRQTVRNCEGHGQGRRKAGSPRPLPRGPPPACPLTAPHSPLPGRPSAASARSRSSSSATAPTPTNCPPRTRASTRCCCQSMRAGTRWRSACGWPS